VELALLSPDGGLSRFAVLDGTVDWRDAGAVDAPATISDEFESTLFLVQGDGSATVQGGERQVELDRVLPPAGGLAIYDATVRFRDLTCQR
jgi:hypothetical protein